MHNYSRNGYQWGGAECPEMSWSCPSQDITLGWCSHRGYCTLPGLCLRLRLCDPIARENKALSSLLKKYCRENHSEQLMGKENMATAFLNHISGLNEISAAGAYRKEFESHSSLPICLKVNAVDGIRLPWHKTLLCYFAVTQFCTKILWILFSQEQPVAAGISKALGCFPAQMACSSAGLELPQSREQW